MGRSSTLFVLIATYTAVVVLSAHVAGGATSSMDTVNEAQNMFEVLRCFKTMQESGKRIYVSYIGNMMRLFDFDGEEVSCDASKQQRLRQKADRRCIFSPIHCLFNKRIQTAKMLTQMHGAAGGGGGGGGRVFAVRRRR
ncbi:unnamed protein product [Caenorhabditis sp. 36 PRJEB53466]|nr:unnamed protein product [Caenorhabditis sp. 36 PRJEB53466]